MENVGMLKCVLTFHPVQTGYASVLCKLTFFQQLRFFDWNRVLPSIVDLQLTEVTSKNASDLRMTSDTKIRFRIRFWQYTSFTGQPDPKNKEKTKTEQTWTICTHKHLMRHSVSTATNLEWLSPRFWRISRGVYAHQTSVAVRQCHSKMFSVHLFLHNKLN